MVVLTTEFTKQRQTGVISANAQALAVGANDITVGGVSFNRAVRFSFQVQVLSLMPSL